MKMKEMDVQRWRRGEKAREIEEEKRRKERERMSEKEGENGDVPRRPSRPRPE